jgi:hypothetical protein
MMLAAITSINAHVSRLRRIGAIGLKATAIITNVPAHAGWFRVNFVNCRKSSSDWKNEYLPVCDHCTLRGQCGGFFSSVANRRHSRHIEGVSATPECYTVIDADPVMRFIGSRS